MQQVAVGQTWYAVDRSEGHGVNLIEAVVTHVHGEEVVIALGGCSWPLDRDLLERLYVRTPEEAWRLAEARATTQLDEVRAARGARTGHADPLLAMRAEREQARWLAVNWRIACMEEECGGADPWAALRGAEPGEDADDLAWQQWIQAGDLAVGRAVYEEMFGEDPGEDPEGALAE